MIALQLKRDLVEYLRDLATTTNALVPVAKLPKLWKLSEDEAADLAVDLLASGDIEAWDHPDRPRSVILSQSAAESFGLFLAAGRDSYQYRWVSERLAEDADEAPRCQNSYDACTVVYANAVVGDEDDEWSWVDAHVDPHAVDPAVAAELADEAETSEGAAQIAKYIKRTGRAPAPLVLLEGCGRPWPLRPLSEGPCEACGGGPLPYTRACLWCDRSGMDAALPKANPKGIDCEDARKQPRDRRSLHSGGSHDAEFLIDADLSGRAR